MRALPERVQHASVALTAVMFLAVMPAGALASRTTFSFTGNEQTYTVPAGITALYVTATGAAGGGPTTGTSLVPGRGAVAMGKITVTPGETLYIEVGGVGASPLGGFNGGGNGGDLGYISENGGGGASDVRTIARSAGGSLGSRMIVAGGGGGSGYPAAGGGNAGEPGHGYPDPAAGGGAGTQSSGGAGGCTVANVGCGFAGTLGIGGVGGASGAGADAREGAGGGGGYYGGGGGAGVDGSISGAVGGGGGGSSLLPTGGVALLADFTQPASVVISTKIPKYTAYELPVYLCFDTPDLQAGTVISNVSYLDKGDGDVHLENVPAVAAPSAAGWTFAATLNGTTYATYTLDQFGMAPTIELTGSAVPAVDGFPVADLRVAQTGLPVPPGFVVASSICSPSTP